MQAKNGLFDSFIESVIYPYPWYGVPRVREYVMPLNTIYSITNWQKVDLWIVLQKHRYYFVTI